MGMLIEIVKIGQCLLRSMCSPLGSVHQANPLFSLPFASDNGSGLGIAVKTYLDAVNEEPEVTDALKTSIKQQQQKYNWFRELRGGGNLTKSLDQAWKIWDAVSRPLLGIHLPLMLCRFMLQVKYLGPKSEKLSSSLRPMTGFLFDGEDYSQVHERGH